MISLEYAAGFFDGEGCVRIQTPGTRQNGEMSPSAKGRVFPSYQVAVQVGNTSQQIVLAFQERFGGNVYRNEYFTRQNQLNRVMFEWRAMSRVAHPFLVAVEPFLIVKREEAQWAIRLQEHINMFRYGITHMDAERKSEVFAYRKSLADRLKALKKPVHGFLIDGNGPSLSPLREQN